MTVMIRSFDLRDIPTLRRYQEHGLFLDSIPTLTKGPAAVFRGAMLSPLSVATGVFTSVCQEEDGQGRLLVGQVVHATGSPFAHFTFLAPEEAVDSPALPMLVEDLVKRVGERGAHNLTAEVEEKSEAFAALKRAGFSIYARQRIWRVSEARTANGAKSAWRAAISRGEIPVRRLYNEVVPALVQQVEPAPWDDDLHGMVHYEGDELLAFVDVIKGPRGMWAQPFIHPEMEDAEAHFAQLLGQLGPRSSRPAYFCLRSYQSWLAAPLEELGAEAGPSQAVMVKRLAVPIKALAPRKLPAIEGGQTKITTPSRFQVPENGDETS